MADINEWVKEEWKQTTTARERIKEVLVETTEYMSAAGIAERALTSEPTTRKYLEELVDDGFGVTAQDGRTTTYKRHEGRLIDERIEELRTTCTQQELIDGIRGMKETLEAFRETYDADGPEEAVMELAAGDEGWADIGRWRGTRRNLAIAQAALQVDEAHRLAEA
ncbi:DUF7342 family protein [Halococcus salifodinae]|uniref:Transcriptional regulator n=1 Tax=Halococcus salifodinae DSM 8989 TaxID=1227456 RepID=M0N699_9EURY|nr:hypothetical protein [Halococcus salifodinae]EMA52220.1 hypothetical protein C450_11631 [Halococcus salifodinae DSM 8989]